MNSALNINNSREKLRALQNAMQQAVIGQQHTLREVIVALIAAGHVLIEGVPGLGKTLIARALAAAIDGKFNRLQFTPDLMPSDVTGHTLYDMKAEEFKVRRGPIFCNILLADEINRAPAKTQSALLEAMQEQQVTIEGHTFNLSNPFIVLATQNPIEQEGTYPLPEAQLDRFLLNIKIDYPEADEEENMLQIITQGAIGDKLDLSKVNKILDSNDVLALQQTAAQLTVDTQINRYVVAIVRATRSWNGVEIGAGPRGSLALLRAARAHALLNGNPFVTPDDVKSVAPAVLRHRITLNADLEIEGYRRDDILHDILANIEAPRI